MAIADPLPARAALAILDVSVEDLWVDYIALGGALSLPQLVDFLAARSVLLDSDYNQLAQAINELFMDSDMNHPVPYAEDIHRSDPGSADT